MPTDPRLLLPIGEQIRRLRDLVCEHNPGSRFTRTVPVQPTDHDIMLIELCDKAENPSEPAARCPECTHLLRQHSANGCENCACLVGDPHYKFRPDARRVGVSADRTDCCADAVERLQSGAM